MAITADQIKILESERLTDTDDGGGRATGRIVESGDVNAVFPPIDRIDQAFGEFSARKLFAGPQTASTEVYYGVHSAIIQDAMDKNINLLMCDTKSDSDNLRDLKDYVESYQVKASQTTAILWGEHLQHQQIVVMYMPVVEDEPAPSDVLFLNDGKNEQAIRIKRVSVDIRDVSQTVNGNLSTFQIKRVSLELFNSLDHNYDGQQPSLDWLNRTTKIYTSRASSGVKYFGVKRLAQAVASGASTANVGDLFMPLAPASKSTDALTNQKPFLDQSILTDIGPVESVTIQLSDQSSGVKAGYLPFHFSKTSTITWSGRTFNDRGDGVFLLVGGSGGVTSLTIDRVTRRLELKLDSGVNGSNSLVITGAPACLVSTTPYSIGAVIDAKSQRTTYIFDLSEVLPQPELTRVSFRVLGKSYTAKVRGDGVIHGDATGRLDTTTGLIQITLPALPDIASALIVTWTSAEYINVSTTNKKSLKATSKYELTLDGAAERGSLNVKWLNDGSVSAATTAIDDGKGRLKIGGDDVGYIIYANPDGVSQIFIEPQAKKPDSGTAFQVSYNKISLDAQQSMLLDSTSPNEIVTTLTPAPQPGSICFDVVTTRTSQRASNMTAFDEVTRIMRRWYDVDGGFNFIEKNKNTAVSVVDGPGLYGKIEYESGNLLVRPCDGYESTQYSGATSTVPSDDVWRPPEWPSFDNNGGAVAVPRYSISAGSKHKVNALEHLPPQTIMIFWQSALAPPSENVSESHPVGNLVIDLIDYDVQQIIEGSVRLTFGDQVAVDNRGTIILNPSTTTGAGSQIGTIDYSTQQISLQTWPDGDYDIVLVTAATAAPIGAGDSFVFNTKAYPVAPLGFTVNAIDSKGDRYSGVVDGNGDISGGDLKGRIDQNSGLVTLYGVDPNAAPDAENKLLMLVASSITYSAVIETLLPLDKAVIKIDPIRLPPDGRVPIYRAGDLLLLSHTASKSVGTPTAGQVVSVDRTYLAACDVVDSKGKPLKQAMRSIDLKAGTVTFSAPLSFVDEQGNQLSPPLVVKHRIEHMSPIADVQLNGDLKLLTAAYHDYPADETVVCSCPIHGDRWARAHTHFTQKNWDSGNPTWSDDRIGPDTAAKYDTINYPFELTNQGSVNERWALVFTGQTLFEVVGESLGVIATGNTGTDCAPINPNTKTPYFLIRADGWGSGWAVNNVVRFNTDAAISPIWLIRVTQPGKLEIDRDEFVYQIRGDVV